MKTDRISLLLPTRGRPFLVKRLFQSIVDCSVDLNRLEVVLCVDDDDTDSQQIKETRLKIVKVIGERTTMGGYNTRCMENSSGDVVILLNDDLQVKTHGWDQKIIDFCRRMPDPIFLAYPDDMEAPDLCTFPILSRTTCEIFVEPYPLQYEHLFIDDHIYDTFIRLKHLGHNRMFYLKDIELDHRHFINGKQRQDVSYQHKNRYKDYITYISLAPLRQAAATRLHAAIEGKPLPTYKPQHRLLPAPAGMREAFKLSASFLTDHGLPMRRRLLWFIRFSKYYAAMKGGLGFLKAKTYTLYGS